MTDGDLMMKIIGLLILTSQAVTAWALLTGRAQRREIAPQPLDVRTTHESVSRPEFDKHRDEIWEVINGIRRGISRTSEDIESRLMITPEGRLQATRLASGQITLEAVPDIVPLPLLPSTLRFVAERLTPGQTRRVVSPTRGHWQLERTVNGEVIATRLRPAQPSPFLSLPSTAPGEAITPSSDSEVTITPAPNSGKATSPRRISQPPDTPALRLEALLTSRIASRRTGNKLAPVPTSGPGTELKKLLRRIGITAVKGCRCDAHAREMDTRGPDWSEANLDTIIAWLRAEAQRRHLPFLDPPARLIVKLAIKRARIATP